MLNMEKRLHKRIAGLAKNNGDRLLDLFHTLDFQQTSNSRGLRSTGENGNGGIPADNRYSRRVLDQLSDFAEKDRGSSLPSQDEAKNDIGQGVKCKKNDHFSESGNMKSREAQMDHDSNYLWELCDKSSHMQEMATPEALDQSDDLLDTLKVLSSDKEMLDQLIWGPHSNSMKHVQECKNPCRSNLLESASVKFFKTRSALKAFRRGKGSDIQKPKGSLTKIVVLKPIPSRMEGTARSYVGSRRATSAISFPELKNRFKHAMGERKKEGKCRSNSRDIQDGVGLSNNGVKTHVLAIDSSGAKNGDGVENRYRQKPKGRMMVMLHPKDGCEHQQERETSKALWNVLSLENYGFSPVYSPRIQRRLCLSPRQMRFCPLSSSNEQGNSNKSEGKLLGANKDAASHAADLSSELFNAKSESEDSTMEVAKLQGQARIVDNNNCCNETIFEKASVIGEMSDDSGHGMARLDETHADEETQSRRSESTMETKSSTPSNPPSTLLMHKKEAPGIIMEKLEHPSPVFVLIPPFTDDATSLSSPVSKEWEDGLSISPRKLLSDDYDKSEEACDTSYFKREMEAQMEMEEFNHQYVGSLLDASGLIHVETWRKKQSLCNLLDRALLDEVETPFGGIPCNLKLLFDCIAEALEGIREKFFPQKPWAAPVKCNVRPFPCRESLVQEVCGKITSQQATLLRSSMNQVIEKDLDTVVWMDTSAEINDVGFEIEDETFDELLEELVVDICSQVEPCR